MSVLHYISWPDLFFALSVLTSESTMALLIFFSSILRVCSPSGSGGKIRVLPGAWSRVVAGKRWGSCIPPQQAVPGVRHCYAVHRRERRGQHENNEGQGYSLVPLIFFALPSSTSRRFSSSCIEERSNHTVTGCIEVKVCVFQECFAPYSIAMALQRHSPLKRKFDRVISWMLASGLVRHWFLESLWLSRKVGGYRWLILGLTQWRMYVFTIISYDCLWTNTVFCVSCM